MFGNPCFLRLLRIYVEYWPQKKVAKPVATIVFPGYRNWEGDSTLKIYILYILFVGK